MSAVCQRTEQSTDVRTARVVDLDAVRLERLVPRIVEELRARGAAVADVSGPDVDRWRAAARYAGRRLGWRVRTGGTDGRAWVTSEDWTAPSGADRTAANLFAMVVSGARPAATVVPLRRSR